MAPKASEQKAEKSYLTTAVDSINPWAGKRTSSPAGDPKAVQYSRPAKAAGAAPVDPGDHSTTHLYGQSFHTYPADCPPLHVQWYHAIDVPKRKPQWLKNVPKQETSKQPTQPKKFSAFSTADSKMLETRYQKLLEKSEDDEKSGAANENSASGPSTERKSGNVKDDGSSEERVAVNEDYLFDVNIPLRELAPVYWLGPVYEVRRGTWFFNEGSTLKPCEENLAAQLEEGYLKLTPWLNPVRSRSQSNASRPTPRTSHEDLKAAADSDPNAAQEPQKEGHTPSSSLSAPSAQPQSHRLFGTYMSSLATYQDASTAWLSSDTMLSWVTSSVYERFSGGGYMSGIKLTRGFSEPSKAKEKDSKGREKEKEKDTEKVTTVNDGNPGLDTRQQKILNRRSAPPATMGSVEEPSDSTDSAIEAAEAPHSSLQRQLSSLMEGNGQGAQTEEQIQQRQEQEMQDYHAQAGETQEREIDHLILVTHGIGQQLSLRMESVNFVHDVNVLRKTLKSVYAGSADLKALNAELGTMNGNCRVQVLPVCWRHLLDFPKQRQKRGDHDLGDADGDENDYPSLQDITIEGVAFARSLISDLALDVLLYQSSYRSQISGIVLKECNRIIKLYKGRNPDFKGKFHVMGHSLGSAILFDILCQQKDTQPEDSKNPLRFWPSQGRQESSGSKEKDRKMALDFEVEDFYCLGSPIGLFEMLEGRTIAARQTSNKGHQADPLTAGLQDDPFLSSPMGSSTQVPNPACGRAPSVSSPKARQLFNIFHPSDPISYRLEPLVSPVMSTLKPQGLPYTKKGLLTAANQGLTGIGATIGQSVSGLWSSLSAGIASNMLNRSLGLTSEEVARMTDQVQSRQRKLSPGAGTNISAGGVIADDAKSGERTDERKKQLADGTASREGASTSGNDPTLIDDELETLFSQFQKKRTEATKEDTATGETQDAARKLRKMRAEEAKVRALNRNGRVDYSIQESVLDFNPINTIASHMGYWADADVNHFILSQLLSSRLKSEPNDVAKQGDKRGPLT